MVMRLRGIFRLCQQPAQSYDHQIVSVGGYIKQGKPWFPCAGGLDGNRCLLPQDDFISLMLTGSLRMQGCCTPSPPPQFTSALLQLQKMSDRPARIPSPEEVAWLPHISAPIPGRACGQYHSPAASSATCRSADDAER